MIAVCRQVVVIVPAGSLDALGAVVAYIAVRHHEVDSCQRLEVSSRIFRTGSAFVYNIVGAERYGGQREYQQESQ